MRTRTFGRLDFGSEDADPRAQMWWAVVGVVVLVTIFAVVAGLYLRPPGTDRYMLEIPESGGLAAGDDVRIAGVPVGRVEALELDDDHVDVEFSVDSEHFIGDRTEVSVRMLSPVGGLYVALLPAGDDPLTGPIPLERAQLPFLVADMFAEADAVIAELDTAELRRALDATARSLDGSPGALETTATDIEAVMDVMARQKTQVEDLLSLSNEYLGTVNANQDLALEIIRGYAVLGPQLLAAADDVKTFADGLAGLSGLLFDFLSGPYASKVEPIIPHLKEATRSADELRKSTEEMLDSVTGTVRDLSAVAGPEGRVLIDQSGLTLDRPEVCLPQPGMRC
ncbi:MlaD family protein [Dietzia lutea]|uniref:Mammalian cell entry protein n=1 Tax=Dietzia lutea TaxID=546160 RepID=A0A2S1R4E1_9ACTN|nr:MlaD family protein [Dietzia lutea]AWH91149.1 mammalian cell entry protein [Dietzia lutea]